MNYDVSASQLRAARSLLDWDLRELATRSGVSVSTLQKYERDGLGGHLRLIRNVLRAFNDAGVEFPSNSHGVTLRDTQPEAAA